MNVRIATYNLFEGAAGSYNRLVEFVRDAKLDVLCLQEVNGWGDNDSARLKDFTDKVLFADFAYGNSNTEYKLATISRHPILNRTLHAEAFWHAALEVKVQLGDKQVSVFNVHLDPWQEASREREIARLLAGIPPGTPAIITGDFNSLSRQDNYPPELLQQLQSKGITKFGDSALEFRVIDRLLQAGFVDASAALGKFDTTVPSAFNTDRDHEVPVRVDYIFVSPDLAPLVRQVEVVKNDLANAISDHFPLIVTLGAGDNNAPPPAFTPVSTPTPAPSPPPAPTIPPLPATPVKPWVPEPDPDQPKPPPEPPKPEDGEVIMWSHDRK